MRLLLALVAAAAAFSPPLQPKIHAGVAVRRLPAPALIAPAPEKLVRSQRKQVSRQTFKAGDGAVRLITEAQVAVRSGNATTAVAHARGGLKLHLRESSPEWKLLRKLNQLLAALGDDGHLDAAHDVYEAMVDAGLRPTQVTFGTLIARAGRWRKPRVAASYYRDMLRRGMAPDAQTHNSLINAFVKAGDLSKACLVASTMRQRGVQPTLVTYNTLLDGSAKAGNLTLARQTLSDMKLAGIKPSERTYSIMIHLFAKRGRVDAAFEWFQRMEQNGIRPNVVTYTSLIDACAKAGKLERAFALLAEMKLTASSALDKPEAVAKRPVAARRSPQLDSTCARPNVVTYTSLIDACAKARQPRRAVSVFRQMIDAGVAPNDITCNALFSGCLQQGEVLLAREVLQYMTQNGLRPSAHSFTALLADAASGSAAFACLLRQMQTGQLTGGSPMPVPAVDGAGEAAVGDLEKLLDDDLVSDLERAPQPFLADGAKPAAPELQRVFGIFGQMRLLGVPADRAAYNALINACARAGDVPRAEGAFGEMVAAGIPPDAISFSSLIKACAVAGDAERAEEMFREMQQRTNHFTTFTPPSSHTYAHLMAAHRRAGNPPRVLELLDEMSALETVEASDEASDVSVVQPSVVHFSLALQACERFKELPLTLERGMGIYRDLRARNLRLDSRGMLALSRICEAHGRADLAQRLRQERSMDLSMHQAASEDHAWRGTSQTGRGAPPVTTWRGASWSS